MKIYAFFYIIMGKKIILPFDSFIKFLSGLLFVRDLILFLSNR